MLRKAVSFLSFFLSFRGIVLCQTCTVEQHIDNCLSESEAVDRQLVWNVAWSYFTVQCQGCAASTKSSLISACSQLYLTGRSSGAGGRRVDVFSSTAALNTRISVGLCWHGHAALKGVFHFSAKVFNAQQIFTPAFAARKQHASILN